jgi:hypothetical protein
VNWHDVLAIMAGRTPTNGWRLPSQAGGQSVREVDLMRPVVEAGRRWRALTDSAPDDPVTPDDHLLVAIADEALNELYDAIEAYEDAGP